MTVYIVLTNFYEESVYGVYSSLLKAQQAIKDFIEETKNYWTNIEDTHNYAYLLTDKKEETYYFEIVQDTLQ